MTFKQAPLCLLLTTIFFSIQTHAQTLVWSKKAEDALSESKRLIVMLVNPDDVPERYVSPKRKFMQRTYEQYAASFNEMIREPIQAHWHLTSKIEFKTVAEVIELRKKATSKQKDEILLMTFPDVADRFFRATDKMTSDDVADFSPEKVSPAEDMTNTFYIYRFSAVYLTPGEDNSLSAGANFALAVYKANRWYIGKSDLIFGLENAQDLLHDKVKGGKKRDFNAFNEADKGKLAGKTLLIPQEYMSNTKGKKMLTEAELKKTYPWPYRVVSPADIDAAIEKKDATAAVVISTEFTYDTNNIGTYFWAVDASDAHTILGFSTPGNKNIGVATIAKEHDVYDLNERRMEEIVKNAQVEKK